MPPPDSPIHRYHDGTKHHFTHFARSLGHLDWASQPRPFRSFSGAPVYPLFPSPDATPAGRLPRRVDYADVISGAVEAEPLSAVTLGDLLRHALGLSAWKESGRSRWSLRVNPSSGNLHPTEAYVVCGPLEGLADGPAVYHYAADRHVLELRALFDAPAWDEVHGPGETVLLVALTSIHWRESWKYGERAFRYCQHDIGHAMGALNLAAVLAGWRMAMLPTWPHRAIAQATGLDRDEDFVEAEREEPACIMALTVPGATDSDGNDGRGLLEPIRNGTWSGRAGQLSEDHVEWTFIDEVARATEDEGAVPPPGVPRRSWESVPRRSVGDLNARDVILKRRSAVAFDGRSTIGRSIFFDILSRAMPGPHAPWDALWWKPRVHFLIFVHRVDDVAPGLYLLARDRPALGSHRAACGR